MGGTVDRVIAREVFDSRGVATIEVELWSGATRVRAAAPFGAPGSRGEFEASAYGAGGVSAAVTAVEREIAPRLLGADVVDLDACDRLLREVDGTANFDRLGGNTSSTVSTAMALLGAQVSGVPLHAFVGPGTDLPRPLGNIIGGGAHAMGPTPDMQEHLTLPVNASSLREAVEWNILVHEATGRLLAKNDASFTGGSDDERAWAADLDDTGALDVIRRAAAEVNAATGAEFRLGLDVAADRMWDRDAQVYRYHRAGRTLTPAEHVDFMESLVTEFDLGYVEDAFESTDYESFAELNRRVGSHCLVVGDDLLATNTERTLHGTSVGSVNAMIVKVNQVGTVTGARDTNAVAQEHGVTTAISHRSGETDDWSIAHFGTAWGCRLIKAGVTGGERVAKLNELIRLEGQDQGRHALAALPAVLDR